MSLETRLKAAFERVAATIKQRGLPAGGAAGQVLTKTGGADYAAGWVTPAAGGGGSAPPIPTLIRTATGTGNINMSSYVASPAPSPSYPDAGGLELRDGTVPANSANYSDGAWVGWQQPSVTIDLDFGGSVAPYSLESYVFDGGNGGIYSPSAIAAYRSDDGVNWVAAGAMEFSGVQATHWWAAVTVNGAGRYWRLEYDRRGDSGWIFIAEVRAMAQVFINNLPDGYGTRVVSSGASYGASISVTIPTKIDVVNTQNVVKASAWVSPGDVLMYSE